MTPVDESICSELKKISLSEKNTDVINFFFPTSLLSFFWDTYEIFRKIIHLSKSISDISVLWNLQGSDAEAQRTSLLAWASQRTYVTVHNVVTSSLNVWTRVWQLAESDDL